MAEQSFRKPTHADVSNALRTSLFKLRGRTDEALPDSCADLWDDSLELVELLMQIEEELSAALRRDYKLDYLQTNEKPDPKRTATTTEFICWIVKELHHG